LTGTSQSSESTVEGISSMVDTWLLLRDVEVGGERNRLMYVLKSRGMAHSNQVREFLITSRGISLVEPYLGQGGVLTGSARLSQEAREAAEKQRYAEEARRLELALHHRRLAVEAQIAALRAGFKAEEEEFARVATAAKLREETAATDRAAMSRSRRVMATIRTKANHIHLTEDR